MSESRSPQLYARTCGALYLYIIVAGLFAEIFMRSRLVVAGDAVASAGNIIANQLLFRIGFTGELVHLACDVAVAVLLYVLLRPVSRTVALLAACMRLVSDVILAVASVSHFAALRLLTGVGYLDILPTEERQALALLALRLHGDGYSICLFFFAFACLSAGYLIFKSSYLPKAIGVLMAVAGGCYLVNSLAHFLAPALAAALFPVLFVPVFVAELSLALWLIVKGVDAAKWQARASPA
jgi:hypothetical protein